MATTPGAEELHVVCAVTAGPMPQSVLPVELHWSPVPQRRAEHLKGEDRAAPGIGL